MSQGTLEVYYTALSDDLEGPEPAPASKRPPITAKTRKQWIAFSCGLEVVVLLTLSVIPYLCGLSTGNSCSILVVSILFTWFHIALALNMCFYPLEFRGLGIGGLSLGWQGIVPRKACKMARKSCDLIIDRLIYVDDILELLHSMPWTDFMSSSGFYDSVEKGVESRLRTGYLSYSPTFLFKNMRDISVCIQNRFMADLIGLLKNRRFFDISDLIISEFISNKELLVTLFTQVGHKELIFIERSGAIIGLVCGLTQVCLYSTVENNAYAFFSLSGLIIGLATNWLALFVIFNPINPIVVFRGKTKKSSFVLHSLFLRRQDEASTVYSQIVTDSVLNVDTVVNYLNRTEKMVHIERLLHRVLRSELTDRLSFKVLTVNQRERFVNSVSGEIECEIPVQVNLIKDRIVSFIERNIHLKNRLYKALSQLSYREFDGILHPVFKEDEPLLIALGGLLGGLVGLIQVYMFGL
jgi:uncharacterized membrane protein YheB (UPF0754 family)